jgi:hypothetical protein
MFAAPSFENIPVLELDNGSFISSRPGRGASAKQDNIKDHSIAMDPPVSELLKNTTI